VPSCPSRSNPRAAEMPPTPAPTTRTFSLPMPQIYVGFGPVEQGISATNALDRQTGFFGAAHKMRSVLANRTQLSGNRSLSRWDIRRREW
jgi:hypothetical protein